jgi:hypothetical protein
VIKEAIGATVVLFVLAPVWWFIMVRVGTVAKMTGMTWYITQIIKKLKEANDGEEEKPRRNS